MRSKNTYSRMHCGHFMVTLFSSSPWTEILVPQKSHLLHNNRPLNSGRALRWLLTDWVTGFSSILEEPSEKEIIFSMSMRTSFDP